MYWKTVWMAGLLGVSSNLMAQEVVQMNDLDVSKIWQEYGSAFVQDSVMELQARSVAKVKLDGKAERFEVRIGLVNEHVSTDEADVMVQPLVDGTKLLFRQTDEGGKRLVGVVGKDGSIANGSVRFILKADGKEVYNSGVFSQGTTFDVDIPLKGVQMLEIEIDPTSDGASGDCLRLVSPRFTYQGVRPELADVNALGEGPKQSAEVVKRLTEKVGQLPIFDALLSERTPFDWLLTPEKVKAGIYRSADGKGIVVANALVSRTFRIMPNLATVDYMNRMLGESLLRAVSSEGAVWMDGKKWQIGGLAGQPERGYLKTEWI